MNENKNNEVILIGLPNSGKSTLINSLTNTKSSIVGSEPNTTRDKISTFLELNNKQIILSDLPGFDDNPDDFNKTFQNKLQQFLKDADRILFVIDINSKNFSGLDKINNLLQLVKVETKTTTVFNKCENFNHYDLDKRMFKYIYGKETYISGYHKIGTDELLDNLIKFSGKEINGVFKNRNAISIIGKPNSGKSTLFNAFLDRERSVVSNKPGTTRDSVIEEVLFDDKLFNVIDTAGVPRKKQKDQIDRYASKLSLNTLDSSLVSFIVIDSSEGINFEDMRLINESVENFCTPILILNKWDLLSEEDKDRVNSNIKIQLKKFTWLKIIRISALTKKGLNKFSATLDEINTQLENRIDTSDLNLYFRELWVANPPHPFRGRRAKLKYVTQYDTSPPSFSFNLSSRIPKNYISFIENKLRSDHSFKNVALKIKVKI
ncbi:ribosome biogenesis GTPase Der [Acidimicrobiaceae bacterium]|jgi:GTP-binding protein|nr:ribosome biogenesis GTPase Der [Acidimicrobiaceae bacterium]